jgi:hypothetical protein
MQPTVRFAAMAVVDPTSVNWRNRPTAALRQSRRQRPDDRAIARKRTPICSGAMRIIAFITDAPTVCDILVHLGEFTAPPRIAPARMPK